MKLCCNNESLLPKAWIMLPVTLRLRAFLGVPGASLASSSLSKALFIVITHQIN